MMSNEGKTIVVAGATGRQGGQVVRHLLNQGWRVRALTRKPKSKKAAALRRLGAEVTTANLNDQATLEAAFKNAYGVFNVQSPVAGKIDIEIQQGTNVAAAAKETGIQHLVYGSGGPGNIKTGIEQWDAKVEIAQVMERLGLPLTVLRPVAFMELMVDPSFYPSSSTWHIWPRLSGSGCKIPWISVHDVGAIAASVFANPDEYCGKDLMLASDVQSLDECRVVYKEVLGRYPLRFPMPLSFFELFVGKDIPEMWRWLREHPINVDVSQTYRIYPASMTVRTWLRTLRSG